MRRDLGRLKSCHNGGELISSLYYYVDENRLLSCDEEFYCQLLFDLSSTGLLSCYRCDFVSDIYFVHNCYAPFEDMWTIRNGNSLSGPIIVS